MPEFSIYKSEHSVRIENTLLKQKMRELEAENARLRAKAGEEPIAVSALAASEESTSFKAGNCSVQIGQGAGRTTGQASVNPARTPRPPQRQPQQQVARRAPQPQRGYQYSDDTVNGGYADQQEQAQPAMVGSQPAARRVDDGDEAVMRFSMLELD